MSTPKDSRQIVSSFLAARIDPSDDRAVEMMAPTFTFESPLLRIGDRDAYLLNHRGFQALVIGVRMISELYGTDEATLIYDLETATPVGIQRTAEHFRIERGKVASIAVLFDSAPWRPIFGSERATPAG